MELSEAGSSVDCRMEVADSENKDHVQENDTSTPVSVETPEEEALRNQLVVETLLNFLPLASLKILRQVSKSFNTFCVKEMFKKYYLCLSNRHARLTHHTERDQVEDVISKYDGVVQFKNIKISAPERYHLGNTDIFQGRESLFGQDVQKIILHNYMSQPGIREFCNHFAAGHMPNLRYLYLSNLPTQHTDEEWTILLHLFDQLHQLYIGRMSPNTLVSFFNLGKDAPRSVIQFLPGLANWVAASDGFVPRDSLVGGREDEKGHNLFVARAHHASDLLPGQLESYDGVCYVPWDGRSHAVRKYETFVIKEDQVDWIPACSDEVVPGAVAGGMTNYGEILFVGRVLHEGSMKLGKIHRSHRVLYTSRDGREIAHSNYEALVLKGY